MAYIDLKPCPFCGGKGLLSIEQRAGWTVSFVKCLNCGAETGLVEISTEYSSDEKAAEAWNRRVIND